MDKATKEYLFKKTAGVLVLVIGIIILIPSIAVFISLMQVTTEVHTVYTQYSLIYHLVYIVTVIGLVIGSPITMIGLILFIAGRKQLNKEKD